MPSKISDDAFGQALLHAIQDGGYPEAEEVISADLPSPALPVILELLGQARLDVKASIRELSRDTAPDINGWISQAKHLRDDIEASRITAEEIVRQARDGEQLQASVQDANSKVNLLNGEVIFNEMLAETLAQIQTIRHTLASVQEAAMSDRLVESVGLLEHAENELQMLRSRDHARIAEVLRAKALDLRKGVVETLTECWNALIRVDVNSQTITISYNIQRSATIEIDTVVMALTELDLLKSKILMFRKDFDAVILTPRLQPQSDGTVGSLRIEGNDIHISERLSDTSIATLAVDISSIIEYLATRLPSSVAVPLSEVLMPTLTSRLISVWLSPSIPPDLDGMKDFQAILGVVLKYADKVESYGWHGKDDLVEWVERAPRVWLTKRRETSLDRVRRLLLRGFGNTKTVERAETQIITREDDLFTGNKGEDDWDAEWSDNDENARPGSNKSPLGGEEEELEEEEEEEEGVSAWGLDEDTNEERSAQGPGTHGASDVAEDAWGWRDDNEDGEVPPHAISPRDNGNHTTSHRTQREVTLKEAYNITALPEEILEIIKQIVADAETLAHPDYAESPISPAAAGLLSLPALVLAMYRASASTYYSQEPSGSMFLYNDNLWLGEQLRSFSREQASRALDVNPRVAGKLDLSAAVSALEGFGKRCYGKEMESQRTILGDLLDGAQGFSNCTEHPFAQECDVAIASVVDRLRDVHKQWKTVLSHSALLQSLGSLLSTVCNKIIVDVEDMSDISEVQSQRLASFCNRIASLEELFTSEQPRRSSSGDKQAVMPLTAVYTPHWLKFQYLSNILESSLVDIKYLWSEGELSLYFSMEEVIDLIEALFADSVHRRRAIGEIRRSSFGR